MSIFGTGRPQVALLSDYQVRAIDDGRFSPPPAAVGFCLHKGRRGCCGNAPIECLYPEVKRAATEIPEPARKYLQQAFETLNAPDAAAVMAGSAVDAMLKHLKLVDGSVYSRIDEAVRQHILTAAMGEWAHEVRLGSNRPRHADVEDPHVSLKQAQQSVEFAEALGHFLFVLSSRVNKGIADAKNPEQAATTPVPFGGLAG